MVVTEDAQSRETISQPNIVRFSKFLTNFVQITYPYKFAAHGKDRLPLKNVCYAAWNQQICLGTFVLGRKVDPTRKCFKFLHGQFERGMKCKTLV